MCDCPPYARNRTTIEPRAGETDVKTVVLTICNCDKRQCPINGCGAYARYLGAGVCSNGHRLG